MHSYRLVRFTLAVIAAVIVPFLLFAFDAVAGTQRARNGTTLTVPYANYISGDPLPESLIPMFEIKQNGGGIAGRFEITNPNSSSIALDGVNAGSDDALLAWNRGLGRAAQIITSNSQNTLPALDVSSQSLGSASYGLAAAADIRANNTNTIEPAMNISTAGRGGVLQVNNKGPSGNLAAFQTAGVDKVRLSREGSGLFAGEVRTADHGVSEAIRPDGLVSSYKPGDVLVVSTINDDRVTKTTATYSRRVVGVYADSSGLVATGRSIDASLRDTLKVGILGLFPTRVTAQNGAIHRGDLLVTSSTAGAAMRATSFVPGTIIGKAMGEFSGTGTGLVSVMVSLQ